MDRQADARALARDALIWLAERPDLMGTFLGASGLDAAEIRRRADDPEMLAAVLDFLLMDEAWLGAFCAQTGRSLDAPLRARAALPGGDAPHWT